MRALLVLILKNFDLIFILQISIYTKFWNELIVINWIKLMIFYMLHTYLRFYFFFILTIKLNMAKWEFFIHLQRFMQWISLITLSGVPFTWRLLKCRMTFKTKTWIALVSPALDMLINFILRWDFYWSIIKCTMFFQGWLEV